MNSDSGTILLAEDNEDDAYLTKRALESAGISQSIHHCRDGQGVIDYLQGILSEEKATGTIEVPALILLDLKMPRVDGLAALKWIRHHEIFHPLIVLALTSSSEQRDVKTASDLHINAYLVKPSSLSEMVELARTIRCFWLEQRHLIKPHISFS